MFWVAFQKTYYAKYKDICKNVFVFNIKSHLTFIHSLKVNSNEVTNQVWLCSDTKVLA